MQPNHGLDQIFGEREDEVEFMPDIGECISFAYAGQTITGGGFLQSYTIRGGTECGQFTDGRVAVVENTHGNGRTLLVGTHPGVAHFKSSGEANRPYFSDVFARTGKTQHVRLPNFAMQARLHHGESGNALWVVNPTREIQHSTVELAPQHGPLNSARPIGRGGEGETIKQQRRGGSAPRRDGGSANLAGG